MFVTFSLILGGRELREEKKHLTGRLLMDTLKVLYRNWKMLVRKHKYKHSYLFVLFYQVSACNLSPCITGNCSLTASAPGYSCECPPFFSGDNCEGKCCYYQAQAGQATSNKINTVWVPCQKKSCSSCITLTPPHLTPPPTSPLHPAELNQLFWIIETSWQSLLWRWCHFIGNPFLPLCFKPSCKTLTPPHLTPPQQKTFPLHPAELNQQIETYWQCLFWRWCHFSIPVLPLCFNLFIRNRKPLEFW